MSLRVLVAMEDARCERYDRGVAVLLHAEAGVEGEGECEVAGEVARAWPPFRVFHEIVLVRTDTKVSRALQPRNVRYLGCRRVQGGLSHLQVCEGRRVCTRALDFLTIFFVAMWAFTK